jgi:alpha-L-arabinofuranosidase
VTTHIRAKAFAALLSAALASALIPVSAGSGLVAEPGVAVLMVDTGRKAGTIDRNVYGQFLEHINHAVVDGLFAEQIRGAGLEAEDFATTGRPSATRAPYGPWRVPTGATRLLGADDELSTGQSKVWG